MGVKPGTLWLKLGELTRWKALCCEATYGYELNLPLMGLKPRTLWFEVGSANLWAIRMLPSTLFKVILRWRKALCKGMLYNHKVNLPLIRFKLPTSWFKVRTTERSAMQILQKKWQSHSTVKYRSGHKIDISVFEVQVREKGHKTLDDCNSPFLSNNFLKTFISLMKHRKCKVYLPVFESSNA